MYISELLVGEIVLHDISTGDIPSGAVKRAPKLVDVAEGNGDNVEAKVFQAV